MRKWLLSCVLTLFVTGGLAGGAIGIRNLTNRPRRPAETVSPTQITVPGPTAEPTQVLAAHPPLRDFDQNPPPFAPAGRSDIVASAPTPTPPPTSSGHMNILLMGIDQRPDEA